MTPDDRFLNQDKSFWAHVRTLGQHLGYTVRNTQQIKVPTITEMRGALADLGLNTDSVGTDAQPTDLGAALRAYFRHRAKVIEEIVEPNLMDAPEAKNSSARYEGRSNPPALCL